MNQWVPVDPWADPPSSSTSNSPHSTLRRSPAFRRKSVSFGTQNKDYPERPRTPNPVVPDTQSPPSYPEVLVAQRLYPVVRNNYEADPTTQSEIAKLLSSPTSVRRMLIETDCKPVCDPVSVQEFRDTRSRSTSSPATVRRWANPETRPQAHEEDSAVVATIANQSSLNNTPEPPRRTRRKSSGARADTPPPKPHSLARALQDNNLSSLD